VGSADAWGYFVGPDICVDGWDCGTDDLHINRKGGSRSGQFAPEIVVWAAERNRREGG
jgi:hypothetical protein